MRITAYAATDVGRHREGNEDNLFSGRTVFAVADGMGGHQAGEVASETALRPISELDGAQFDGPGAATDALRQAIESANRSVVSESQADPSLAGMGTTLTAVLVRDGRLHLAHVGDSRAYLLRADDAITQLTTDHTLVEQLVQDGRLSRDEVATHPQRSVITRAIGVEDNVDVDTFSPLALQDGDQVLLCSDGLTAVVSDERIAQVLATESDGDAAVRQLIEDANEGGGPDNITVVLLRVDDDGTTPAGALDDDVEEDTGPQAPVTLTPPPRSIPIRTRPESDASEDHDWARDMSRYGDRQGVDSGTGLDQRPRGRRILGIITGVIVLLAVLGGGGYLLLSRAYFVGESGGNVAVFNGLPDEVAGVPLHRKIEDTDLPMESLPPFQQDRVRDGVTVGSRAEARSVIEAYRTLIEEEDGAEPAPTAEATQRPTP